MKIINSMLVIVGLIGLLSGGIIIVLKYLDSATWTNEEIKNNEAVASQVIDAIELYRKENREYPLKLENLMPKYISVLPKLKDARFKYFFYKEDNSYSLVIYGMHSDEYDSTKKKWVYVDL